MPLITLITDGACINNPGPGGWAAILRYQETTKELRGGEPHTTNNRMELTALLEGLRAIKRPCEVLFITDSKYVLKGMTEWLPKWKASGWKTKNKKNAGHGAVLNQDLWTALDEAAAAYKVTYQWVKGHGSHADNIRCDRLATDQARAYLKASAEISTPAQTSTF